MPLPIRIANNIDFGKSWTGHTTFVLYTVDVCVILQSFIGLSISYIKILYNDGSIQSEPNFNYSILIVIRCLNM